MRLGIDKKLTVLYWFMVVCLNTALGFSFIHYFTRALTQELHERGTVLVDVLARDTAYHLLVGDQEAVARMVKQIMAQKDVVFCRIEDNSGRLIHQEGVRRAPLQQFSSAVITTESSEEAGEEVFFGTSVEKKKQIGTVYLGISLSGLEEKLKRVKTIIATVVVFSLIAVFLATYLALRSLLGRPISQLVEATKRIARGELSHKIPVEGTDEIGLLADSFNRMTEDLQKTTVSRDYINGIINNMMESLVVLTPEGRIQSVNRTTCDLLGYEEGELIGRPLGMFLEEDPFRRTELSAFLEKGAITNIETNYLSKEGRKIPVLLSVSVIRDKNAAIRRFVCIARDVTERKHLEEQLQRAEKLESVGILAGGIAHDFNNLLTGIIGNITLARMETSPEDKVFKFLIDAERIALSSKELTAKFLTFAEGGAPVKKPVSVAEFLRDSLKASLAGSNVRPEFFFPDDLRPAGIDQILMKQAVEALVLNAVEAMPDGGTLRISAENAAVTPEDGLDLEPGEYVRIFFEDQGEGIPRENLPRIFDPYFSTKQRGQQKGMGLGLAVCYSIIKRHDGLITVESKEGVGTTFRIYLPAEGGDSTTVSTHQGEPQ